MEPLEPTATAPLFRPLLAELLALVRRLSPEEWERRTVAGSWRVRDVVTHLLDGDLRRLSAARDGHALVGGQDVSGYSGILALVNGLNATGVAWGARLSPEVLCDLLAVTGTWAAEHFEALPQRGKAAFAVDWAGEEESENWMDVGREYTERWHHQMQIRDAVGAPGLLDARWLMPLLDLSVRALPRAYAGTGAPDGAVVTLVVAGLDDAAWSLVRERSAWTLRRGAPEKPAVRVAALASDAWKLLFNALPRDRALRTLEISGDPALAEPLLRARAVLV